MRLPLRRPPQAEVDAEIAFHLEQRVRDYIARGMSPESARAAAVARLGDLSTVRVECADLLAREQRAEGLRDWLDDLRQDLRIAVRAMMRAKLFASLAIVTLALGIGANAAVFRVVKSVLLDRLPYTDAGRLVRVYSRFAASRLERSSTSPGAAVDMGERVRDFRGVGAFNFGTFDVAWVSDAGARVLSAAAVTPEYFRTLGVRPALGRSMTEQDASDNVALLSDAAWRREFGGDPAIVGRTLRIEHEGTRVIGVLPPDYVGPMGDADLVFPMDLRAAVRGPDAGRGQHYLGIVARLAPGATPASAQRALDRLSAELQHEHPNSDAGNDFVVLPLRESMVGDTRTPLLALLASAGLVLLITCANVASALLSRTISRRKEFAVRIALGARRGRVVRQLLAESMLLAFLGALVGLALASSGLAVARGFTAQVLPPYADLSLDAGAVLVTLLAALGTGLAFGLAPAVAAGTWQAHGTLREESRGTSESRRARRLRGVLVASQIALSFSVLAGAGLLVRSLLLMSAAPLGFEPDGVLTARVQLPESAYGTPEIRAAFFRQLQERLAAIPGVRRVASVTQIPSTTMSQNILTIDGVTLPGDGPTFVPYMAVSDDYFTLMGIRLVRGRSLSAQDAANGVPAIVISEAMAKRYWPHGDAVGARVHISPHTARAWGTVVGVVRDVRIDPAAPTPAPMAYATNRQDYAWSGRDILIRTSGDPRTFIKAARVALAGLDPTLPLRDARPLREIVDERLTSYRLPMLLMTAFGALALVLSSMGVYAMFATMAAARQREFGVRIALGSGRGAIAIEVLRQGSAWMIAGVALGALGVSVVAHALGGLLFGVAPFDPVALGVALGALLACAVVALVPPVRRATRVDPIDVLR